MSVYGFNCLLSQAIFLCHSYITYYYFCQRDSFPLLCSSPSDIIIRCKHLNNSLFRCCFQDFCNWVEKRWFTFCFIKCNQRIRSIKSLIAGVHLFILSMSRVKLWTLPHLQIPVWKSSTYLNNKKLTKLIVKLIYGRS